MAGLIAVEQAPRPFRNTVYTATAAALQQFHDTLRSTTTEPLRFDIAKNQSTPTTPTPTTRPRHDAISTTPSLPGPL